MTFRSERLIWGAPGIGKSALVQQFADDVGMECVSLLVSQLTPEDIIGIPPKMIVRDLPRLIKN